MLSLIYTLNTYHSMEQQTFISRVFTGGYLLKSQVACKFHQCTIHCLIEEEGIDIIQSLLLTCSWTIKMVFVVDEEYIVLDFMHANQFSVLRYPGQTESEQCFELIYSGMARLCFVIP